MDQRQQLTAAGFEDIWRQFAEQVDGTFTEIGWRSKPRVDARWREWMLTLERYHHGKVQYTQLRTPFLETGGFRFRLYREGRLARAGKKLGLVQDIAVGHPRFDDAWIIQSNDEPRLRSLLVQPRVRALIDALPFDLDFELKDDQGWLEPLPQGVDILSLKTASHLESLEELRQLYELFGAVLDWLTSRGLARPANPGVSL